MQISLDRPEAAFASQDMMQMEHQQSVQQFSENGQFASDYESQRVTPVWGKQPLLLETINFHLNPKQSMCIEFIPNNAKANHGASAIEIKLPSSMLHGLCKLIQDAAINAEWDLNLELPGASSADSDSSQSIKLNKLN